MYIYLVNDKIVLSELEVPKYDGDGYVGRTFIPWFNKTKTLYMFPKDEEFIKNSFPRNISKHHVFDVTDKIYTTPFLGNCDSEYILLIGNLKPQKNMETKTEKYVVMVEGRTSPTKIHDNYETAEFEAKRLCLKEQLPVYICKAVTKVELNQVTITKL